MTKFKAGDRVELSKEALDQKLQGSLNRRVGTVVKVSGTSLRVIRDGMKFTEQWSEIMWNKIK